MRYKIKNTKHFFWMMAIIAFVALHMFDATDVLAAAPERVVIELSPEELKKAQSGEAKESTTRDQKKDLIFDEQDEELCVEQISPSDTLNVSSFTTNELSSSPWKMTMSISSKELRTTVYDASCEQGRMVLWSWYGYTDAGWESIEYQKTASFGTSCQADSVISFSDYNEISGDFKVEFYVQQSSGSTRFVRIAQYPFRIVDNEYYIFPKCGEHEFSYYKDLISSINPVYYNKIPYRYYTNNPDDYYYVGDKMDEIVAKAEQLTVGCTTDEQKVKTIHDWICKNFAYDNEYIESLSSSEKKEYKYTSAPYYTYQTQTAVCAGYSRLNQLMLTSLGIPCLTVSGCGNSRIPDSLSFSTSTNHEWNLVYINNQWYIIDATWDSSNVYYGDSRDVTQKNATHEYYGIVPYAFGNTHYTNDYDNFCYATGITFYIKPSKTKFNLNEDFSASFWITVTLADGSTKYVSSKDTKITGYDMSKCGKQTITVEYAENTTTYEIEVVCTHEAETVEKIIKEANCYQTGTKASCCSACGETLSETSIPATGKHVYGEWTVVSSATCAEKGLEQRSCQTIGCEKKEERDIELLTTHTNLSDWITVTEPTCIEEGKSKRYCLVKNCIYEEEKAVPATGEHKYPDDWELYISPTCIDEGEERKVCVNTGCMAYLSQKVNATGVHNFGAYETVKEANCDEKGLEERVCQTEGCNEKEQRETSTIHNWGDWETITAPTCSQNGLKERKCITAGCAGTEQDELEATGEHVWKNWTQIKAPTCVEEGLEQSVCETIDCGAIKDRAIEKSKTHTFGEWENVVEPTCCLEGIEQRKCSVKNCDVKETRKINATDRHTYEEWKRWKDPGYTSVGYDRRYCINNACLQYQEREIPCLEKDSEEPDSEVTDSVVSNSEVTDSVVSDSEVMDKEDDKSENDDPWDILDIKVGKTECEFSFNVETKEVYLSDIADDKVTSFTVPATVKIGGKSYKVRGVSDKAFFKKTKLKKITIGKNVEKIGVKAFYGCKSLELITFKTTKLTDKTVAKNAFKGVKKSTVIKVPKKKLSAYKKLFRKKGLSSGVKIKA